MISYDSATWDGETNSQHVAREGRNSARARRCTEEANTTATAAVAHGVSDQQRGQHITRNLTKEFLPVDGHDVQPMPSANLTIASNELARIQQMLEIAKATAMLKAAVVQVNDIHENQALSFSTASNQSTGLQWDHSNHQ